MPVFTFTATITLPDGSTAEHTAEALGFKHTSDGAVAILAACCGLTGGQLCDSCNGVGCARCGHRGNFPVAGVEDTRSWQTVYDIGMPTSNGTSILPPAPLADAVTTHVQNVAERHGARHVAKAGLASLVRPLPGGSPKPGTPG
ncbi:MAG TPA: hypothetical protein VJW20_20185 [Candidatus Angelobacter sp.]|nr:hypothetical protein [Candidatus Angelobacter sp.]